MVSFLFRPQISLGSGSPNDVIAPTSDSPPPRPPKKLSLTDEGDRPRMDLSAYRSESYGDIFSLLSKMESAEEDAAEAETTKRKGGFLGKLGIGKKKTPSPTFFAPPLFAALADEEAALQALPPFDFDALEGDGAFFGGQDERTLASSVSLPCLVPICALLSCVACASQTWHLVVSVDGFCVS